MRRALFLVLTVWSQWALVAFAAPPELPDGTEPARKRLATFKVPEGMKVELFAAEPKLASPVAIGLDERNRVYVAEEYRFNLGTEENRTRPFLLEDDLQLQTLDDRLKMYQKFASRFDGGMDWFRKVADQVRLVEDTDGDGKADRSTVFAPDFNGTLDGLAAGVMAMNGDVYFTCIPNLWRLRDTNGDGVADERTILQTGFGVNAGFLGHDLHGLCWGPDGKLYFSVGDRGYHIKTKEGKVLHGPRFGAVFRCDPDGSQLEVVCRGLRNPQELAFDQFGNLFAADNNCDKGDHSRLVYCLPGCDSGWNMANQSIPEPYLTGPWHAEKTWHLRGADVDPQRPAWVLPPVGKLGAGPSGFTYYPGTGLADRYDHHFFLCNYTGNGGIETFSIKPRGAGFEIVDEHDFMKPISATDCEFGYDGKLYVSDFVNLIWNGGSAGGRIYTLFDPQQVNSSIVRQTAQLVRDGIASLKSERLAELLSHPDLRIRQRAQFALAQRGEGSVPLLQNVLTTSKNRLGRLHALWGLGQILRQHNRADRTAMLNPAVASVLAGVEDADDEIRAWSARLVGEIALQDGVKPLLKRLADPSPRVQMFAAMSLGAFAFDVPPEELLELIRKNNDTDPWLAHGCVMSLVQMTLRSKQVSLAALCRDKSPAVRLTALLALRHLHKLNGEWSYDPDQAVAENRKSAVPANDLFAASTAELLRDEQIQIVTEAARAIHDLPLETALPALADMSSMLKSPSAVAIPEALSRRVIDANFRLGQVSHLQRVLSLVVEPSLSLPIRREALAALIDWEKPSPRDRVTGFWRPVPPRLPDEMEQIKSVLADSLPILLGQASAELQADVVKLISVYQLPTNETIFASWVADSSKNVATQVAALRLLATRKSPLLDESIQIALKSSRPQLRAESREVLAGVRAAVAIPLFSESLGNDAATPLERQRSLLALATLKTADADDVLKTWASKLSGQVPEILQLELLDAAAMREIPELKQVADQFRAQAATGDIVSRYRMTVHGGDADKGREIFVGHRVGQCLRCHKVGTTVSGGNAGPDLNHVAMRHDRLSLVQSLVDPSAKIAKGFETVTLVLQDGKVYGGLIKKEDEKEIVLEIPSGEVVTVKPSDIEERSAPKSAMPEMTRALSLRDIRDLVEFLSQLK